MLGGVRACFEYRWGEADKRLSSSSVPWDIGLMAAAHARKGSQSQARECIDELARLAEGQYVTLLAEAFAAIGMGDHDLACHRLEEAIEHKTNFVNLVAVKPFLPRCAAMADSPGC